MKLKSAFFISWLLLLAALASAQVKTASTDNYGPYKFLIGEWNVGAEGGPPMVIERFKWGPNQSYIWFSTSELVNGTEHPHFEGMLMWNGIHKNLDMLLALDLNGGRIQEKGTLSVEADGTVVRDITATYSEGVRPIGQPVVGPEGATGHFRQTFKAVGPDKVITVVMRETKDGWVPTFPGSDHLVMTRKSKG